MTRVVGLWVRYLHRLVVGWRERKRYAVSEGLAKVKEVCLGKQTEKEVWIWMDWC